MQVYVRDNNIDQALRALKKKMQREGVFREMKRRKAYEKPSERKAREKAEAIRRARKAARKQAQREGLSRPPNAGRTRAVRSDGRGRPEFSAKYRRGALGGPESHSALVALLRREKSRLRIERFIYANKLRASSNNLTEAESGSRIR